MSYVELGTELGRYYTSKDTVNLISILQFRTVTDAVKKISNMSRSLGLPTPAGLSDETNLTEYLIGFHNGTILAGSYNPAHASLM